MEQIVNSIIKSTKVRITIDPLAPRHSLSAGIVLAHFLENTGRTVEIDFGIRKITSLHRWLFQPLPERVLKTNSQFDCSIYYSSSLNNFQAGSASLVIDDNKPMEKTLRIISDLLDNPESFIVPDIATRIYYGLYGENDQWRSRDVSAEALTQAGQMLKLGANREDVSKFAYRRATIADLVNWGNVLANLKYFENGLAYSFVSEVNEIENKKELSEEDYESLELFAGEFLKKAIDNLTGNLIQHVIVIWQSPQAKKMTVFAWSKDTNKLSEICKHFNLQVRPFVIFKYDEINNPKDNPPHIVNLLSGMLYFDNEQAG